MSAISALAHSLLQHGISKSSTRCSSTALFVPFARVENCKDKNLTSVEAAFEQDTSPLKLNLCGDHYRSPNGKPYLFQAVRKARVAVICDDTLSHEPLPPLGNPEFNRIANELILNKAASAITQQRVLGIQTRSGLDALRLAAHFLRDKMKCNVCLLARPCSEHFEPIFKRAGFTCHGYQYYSEEKVELNIYGLVADLMTAPEGAVIVLDACAQNPTSLSPTIDEWKLIAHIVKCKKMIPVFNLEFHGLASGDTSQDTWPVRYFAEFGLDLLCVQSLVQNFGLYDEALGHLMAVVSNATHLESVKDQLESSLLEHNAQCSSVFASRVVSKVLTNATLRQDWALTLKDIHQNMRQMRLALSNKLEILRTPGNWAQMKDQQGPHLYTNLKMPQLKQLRSRHIYVPNSGRINVGALRPNNVDYVAGAINDVMISTAKADAAAVKAKDTNLSAMQCLQHLNAP
ncbi:aspartate aminotransferase, cytoplasmic-like [Drosophila sulfurigaster albostrigata]|uniref:aspartate aminotransferase, cytoplasmic-like n=1 Tax=Drosophila sulfurigaster albostrigata TaxID=89887 RepID=UPI002D219402|nr:aspartate aminotransferase, cytoplasmic-like [Drosophila sulfurigaster albostrigata]